jgi:hypothetical protein
MQAVRDDAFFLSAGALRDLHDGRRYIGNHSSRIP